MSFIDTAASNGVPQDSDSLAPQANNTLKHHMKIVTAHWNKFPVTVTPKTFSAVLILRSKQFFRVSPAELLLSLRIVSKAIRQEITSDPNHYEKYKVTLNQDSIACFNLYKTIPYHSFNIRIDYHFFNICSKRRMKKTFNFLIEKKAHIIELNFPSNREIPSAIIAQKDSMLNAIFSSIEKLDLSFSDMTTQEFVKLLPHLKNLKEINLTKCENLSPAIMILKDDQLETTFSSIEKIKLTLSKISTQAFVKLLPRLKNLKEINLTKCENLSPAIMILKDDQLKTIFSSIEKIKLTLSKISTQALVKLLPHLTSLKELNASECPNISPAIMTLTDDQLETILPSIEKLNLNHSYITKRALVKILLHLTNIKELRLVYCHNVYRAIMALTDDQIKAIFRLPT